MKKLLLTLLLVNSIIISIFAQSDIDYLQSITCLVDTKLTQGTGVFITRTNGDVFVLTCGHVVEDSKDSNYKFSDIRVDIFTYQNDVRVGLIQSDATVERYSGIEEYDLCLLKVKQKNFTTNSVKFYSGDLKDIKKGDKIQVMSNFLGESGDNSYSAGVLSSKSRKIKDKYFYQSTAATFPGSSGSGVFNIYGECIGITARRVDSAYNLFIPLDKVKEWAKQYNCTFIFTDSCDYKK